MKNNRVGFKKGKIKIRPVSFSFRERHHNCIRPEVPFSIAIDLPQTLKKKSKAPKKK